MNFLANGTAIIGGIVYQPDISITALINGIDI
jgi:hypothetical protein